MSRVKRPSISITVPMSPPRAMLTMNSTGYSDFGIVRTTALKPSASDASPMAVYMTSWY